MKISKHNVYGSYRRPVFAADDDEFDEEFNQTFDDPDPGFMDEEDTLDDTLDGMADDIEDMQDDLEEITEDDPNIDNENNIDGHYIAECDRCKGIFISAVIESDQEIDKITGICPLCNRNSDQYLKWVVKPVE